MLRMMAYIIAASLQRRAAERAYLAQKAYLAAHSPAVWRKTSIPAVPRKPR